ncbi:MAG: PHP domain-containing protein [Nanoarchaeota archaeon]
MLKVDLHMHSGEDPVDKGFKHDARMLIDRASALGFDAIAITNHEQVAYTPALGTYARSKKFLLIPACEASIEGKDVLIYNVTETERKAVTTFDELRALRKRRGKSILVIAPHAFYPGSVCVGRVLERHPDLFDAIEISQYHYGLMPYNKRAVRAARVLNKPLVATSDAHSFRFFGKHHTLVDAKLRVQDVLDAIRNGKCTPRPASLSFKDFLYVGRHILIFRVLGMIGIKRYQAF